MKLSTNFHITEFVPKEIWERYGENSIWFIDMRVVNICELIRSRFNKPVIINDWRSGGQYHESGYRMPETTTGGKLSQHKFGRAADIKISGISPKEIAKDIIANFDIYKKVGLTTIENVDMTPSWNHIDCRKTDLDSPLIVNP